MPPEIWDNTGTSTVITLKRLASGVAMSAGPPFRSRPRLSAHFRRSPPLVRLSRGSKAPRTPWSCPLAVLVSHARPGWPRWPEVPPSYRRRTGDGLGGKRVVSSLSRACMCVRVCVCVRVCRKGISTQSRGKTKRGKGQYSGPSKKKKKKIRAERGKRLGGR